MREKDIEKKLSLMVKKAGGIAVKFVSPSFDGKMCIRDSVHIVQPRRQNISTFEIAKDDLYRWADEVLKPTAELA